MDEAGRGPVLGPLVVAGVLVPSERAARALGVRDSKKLAPARREELNAEIRVRWPVAVRIVEAPVIDRENLDSIEARAFAEVLVQLGAPRAYLDGAFLQAGVARRLGGAIPVRAEDRADDRRACVAAASIVAKVERDRLVAEIGRELGVDIGSGYPGDAVTISWLRGWIAKHGDLPPCARRKWATSKRLLSGRGQGTLVVDFEVAK